MVHTGLISAHNVLDSLIGCKVDGVGRTSTDDNTRHSSPQTENPLCVVNGLWLLNGIDDLRASLLMSVSEFVDCIVRIGD